jgi:transmembrane sensor
MTKNTGRLNELFALHLNQSATEIEQEEFWGYVNDPMYGWEVKELVAALYAKSENVSVISEDERTVILAQVFSPQRKSVPFSPPVARKLNLWPRFVGVAAAIALIIAGIYFFKPQIKPVVESQYANDVKPGISSATLTLSNGKQIKLTDAVNGELAKEAGVVITKSANGELIYEMKGAESAPHNLNTLSTAKGETYQLRLPDGSLVWLNAASSLTYSANLNVGGKRRVRLEGEGYFEIAKDKEHPFIVETGTHDVEVLGTHFNINSYADDDVEKTTLLEGSVKLSTSDRSKILKPGQQARISGNKITINETDTDLAVAWKNNEFVFESENIETIMKMIGRWYNVEVIYMGEKTNQRFSGKVSRFDKLSKVLEIVESTGEARFDVKGRIIYVSK